MTLDDIFISLDPNRIFFLSIDTEGLNINVLKGAEFTLKRTVLLCLEVDDDKEERIAVDMLSKTHNFVKLCRMGCNILLANKRFVKDLDNINFGNIGYVYQ